MHRGSLRARGSTVLYPAFPMDELAGSYVMQYRRQSAALACVRESSTAAVIDRPIPAPRPSTDNCLMSQSSFADVERNATQQLCTVYALQAITRISNFCAIFGNELAMRIEAACIAFVYAAKRRPNDSCTNEPARHRLVLIANVQLVQCIEHFATTSDPQRTAHSAQRNARSAAMNNKFMPFQKTITSPGFVWYR